MLDIVAANAFTGLIFLVIYGIPFALAIWLIRTLNSIAKSLRIIAGRTAEAAEGAEKYGKD